MKVWKNTTFEGRWPTQTAALVIAETKERAAEMLNESLVSIHLKGDVKPEDMIQVDTKKEHVIILSDGDM